MDKAHGNTDILDMAFISPNLAIHDIKVSETIIEMSIDTTPLRNTSTNHTKYKFEQTDWEVFESTLNEALGSVDFSGFLPQAFIMIHIDISFNIKPTKMLSIFGGRGLTAWSTLTLGCKFLVFSPDTIHNERLRLGTTSLFYQLAKLFTSSILLGYIQTA